MDNHNSFLPPRSSRINQQRFRKEGEDGNAYTKSQGTT